MIRASTSWYEWLEVTACLKGSQRSLRPFLRRALRTILIKLKMLTPVLKWENIELLQAIIRAIRHAGAKTPSNHQPARPRGRRRLDRRTAHQPGAHPLQAGGPHPGPRHRAGAGQGGLDDAVGDARARHHPPDSLGRHPPEPHAGEAQGTAPGSLGRTARDAVRRIIRLDRRPSDSDVRRLFLCQIRRFVKDRVSYLISLI